MDIKIRTMTTEDYDGVKDLWMTIKGFAIRSIDDSKLGVIHVIYLIMPGTVL